MYVCLSVRQFEYLIITGIIFVLFSRERGDNGLLIVLVPHWFVYQVECSNVSTTNFNLRKGNFFVSLFGMYINLSAIVLSLQIPKCYGPLHGFSNTGKKSPALFSILSSKIFCLQLKILIIAEPIDFSILGKLHIGPGMVSFYFILRFKSWDVFSLFFCPFLHLLIRSS